MILDKTQLKGKINFKLYNKISDQKFQVNTCSSLELLTPERFDLLAKYIYIKHCEANIKSNFAEKLYLKHIEVFNGFYEADGSNKIGGEAFLESFKTLIKSVKTKGFDKNSFIPVSNKIALDGAHRLATCLYFKKDIRYLDLNIKPKSFDYKVNLIFSSQSLTITDYEFRRNHPKSS